MIDNVLVMLRRWTPRQKAILLRRSEAQRSRDAYAKRWHQDDALLTSAAIRAKFEGRVPLMYGTPKGGVFERRSPDAGQPLHEWAAYYHQQTVAFYNQNGANELYKMGVRFYWDEEAWKPMAIGDDGLRPAYCVRCLAEADVLCDECRLAQAAEFQRRADAAHREAVRKTLQAKKRKQQEEAWKKKQEAAGEDAPREPMPPLDDSISEAELAAALEAEDELSRLGF